MNLIKSTAISSEAKSHGKRDCQAKINSDQHTTQASWRKLVSGIFSTQSCPGAQNMTFQLATAWFMTSFCLPAYQNLVESWGFHGAACKQIWIITDNLWPVTSGLCLILDTLASLISRSDKDNHLYWSLLVWITVTLICTTQSCQVSNKTLKHWFWPHLSWFLIYV